MAQNSSQTDAPVTRIARRRAMAGQEAAYEAVIRDMFAAMQKSPGFRGADMIPPAEPGGAYQVIVKFNSERDLQIWDESPARAAFHQRARAVAEDEPDYRRLTGLEAWFAQPVVPCPGIEVNVACLLFCLFPSSLAV